MPLQTNKQGQPKKNWNTPRLIIHGTVEKITTQEGCDKNYGESDGYTFLSNPIYCWTGS